MAVRPRPHRRGALALSLCAVLALAACDGSGAGPPAASASPSPSPSPTPARPSEAEVQAELCERVGTLEARVAGLRAVELTIMDRLSLDIELSKVQSAFAALEQTDLGAVDETLEDPLRRLGYRLDELVLAVEDFRTTSRMREAARHVEGDSEVFADEVAAFAIRARC